MGVYDEYGELGIQLKVGFVQSNLLKQAKALKKEAKPWQKVVVRKVEINSDSEVLVNYIVDQLMKGVQ